MEPNTEAPLLESENFSEELRFLIRDCMSPQPEGRPNAMKIRVRAESRIKDHSEYRAAFLNFQLLLEAERGHPDNVASILDNGATIDAKAGTDGEGVLHRAARSGNSALIPVLTYKGGDLLARAHNDETPLHCAAALGHADFVKCLLCEMSSIDLFDELGWGPIHAAAANNHPEVIRILIEEGCADVNIRTDNAKRLTPLHVAAQSNAEGALKHLLARRARIEAETGFGEVTLDLAAENGHVGILEILLKEGARVESKCTGKRKATTLHIASSGGHAPAVDILLQHKANIEARNHIGETPLHCAAQLGHESVMELLLARGAKGEATVKSKNVDKNGWTALHLASAKGHIRVVETLLRCPVNVDARTRDGETALHWAIRRGHEAVTIELLNGGADVRLGGTNQLTPLHLVAAYGTTGMVDTILRKGAKIEAATGSGETPLLLAAQYNRLDMVKDLLKRGASTQATNRAGQNALHLVVQEVRNGVQQIVAVLIDKSARAKAKDGNRMTPLQIVNKQAWSDSGEHVRRVLQEAPS